MRDPIATYATALLLGAYSFTIAVSGNADAVEYAPWYSPIYQVQSHLCLQQQYSPAVATAHHSFGYHAHSTFLNGSMGMAYYRWYGEAIISCASTPHRSCGFDHASLTGRYQLFDDTDAADPVSAVGGLTLICDPMKALRDISSFHHGRFEGEGHIAMGKEWVEGSFWLSRLWGVAALGIADVGSPWFHLKTQWSYNAQERWQCDCYADLLLGLGRHNLSPHRPFKGYGPIRHRSCDLGMRYRYKLQNELSLCCGASYRIWAINFPKDNAVLYVGLSYPFGVQKLF